MKSLVFRFVGVLVAAASSLHGAIEGQNGKVDESLKRGIQYLVEQQDPVTGAIHNKMRNETAMTALAILAMGSTGHQPGDSTPEGQSMRKALNFVLQADRQEDDGYFGRKDGSRMYGHGIVTLTLAEMLGMGGDAQMDELLRNRCRKGIDLILKAQKVVKNDNNRGGWRYSPDAGDSDMSVTVWQTMALRAAKNAGFDVPKESIDEAVRYIKRGYEPTDERKGDVRYGGFGYQGRGREISTTAEGLLALLVCGDYQSEEVLGSSERLFKEGIKQGERWFFYTTYYYAQGMYQRGGKYAETGERLVADLLLPIQSREGWWEGVGGEEKGGGKVYATAMAVLSLAVKNHYLPIYQR
ncbi:MAG TPA: prenyltransferase/squalene oxidase repeat-containing protein [Chthoniobacteraceae bacterium]|jgi:hypothetical protein|nr:prenyltransferase/squalene oxidase repeat-containing protein [Chthoniobacteraceae bacterium]